MISHTPWPPNWPSVTISYLTHTTKHENDRKLHFREHEALYHANYVYSLLSWHVSWQKSLKIKFFEMSWCRSLLGLFNCYNNVTASRHLTGNTEPRAIRVNAMQNRVEIVSGLRGACAWWPSISWHSVVPRRIMASCITSTVCGTSNLDPPSGRNSKIN